MSISSSFGGDGSEYSDIVAIMYEADLLPGVSSTDTMKKRKWGGSELGRRSNKRKNSGESINPFDKMYFRNDIVFD